VAVAVGVGVNVGVGVGVAVGVERGVRVGVGVGVAVGVGRGVRVGVGVAAGASLDPCLSVSVTEKTPSATWEKLFPGLTNSPAAQSSAPSNAGILNGRVPDCFRRFIELPIDEVFVG